MANEGNNVLAQAVFLAQLEAVKSGCKCNACRILRKASDQMTAQYLKPAAGAGSPESSLMSPDQVITGAEAEL